MARPKKTIDENLVRKLATILCTMEEIAAICECSVDTLERRFADVIKKAKEVGKSSLRRLQWESAQKGNITMQIWLGKQHLEQRDRTDVKTYEWQKPKLTDGDQQDRLGPSKDKK